MIKLVLFDLDGTLIDDEIFTITSKVIEGKKLGYNITEEIAKNTLGLSCDISKKYLSSIFGKNFPYEYFREKRFEYIKNDLELNGIRLKKGTLEIIDYLKQNDIKICICTSSSQKYIDLFRKYTDIFDKFDHIITGNMVNNGKPNPDIFIKAMTYFNIDSSETLVIEDSKNGILASLNAKCDAIMIPDLIKPNKELIEKNIKIKQSLLEVIDYVKEVNYGNN